MPRREVPPLRISKSTMWLYHCRFGLASYLHPYEDRKKSKEIEAFPAEIPTSYENQYYQGELL